MGASLSKEEEQELTSHLLGIEPASLAAIIWDTVNNIGVDDDNDKFGINFEEEGESPSVMFWDSGEATEMPRRVFLEILEMVSERIIETYETDYNLDKSPELKVGVDKLQLARQHLQAEISSMSGQESAQDYRYRLDTTLSTEDEGIAEEMVQEVRQRRGSMMWNSGESFEDNTGKMTNRGLEAVVNRLPELRRKYEEGTKGQAMKKMRNKILALGIFGSKLHSTSVKEEDEEDIEMAQRARTPSRHSLLPNFKKKSQASISQQDPITSPHSSKTSQLFIATDQSKAKSGFKKALSQSDVPTVPTCRASQRPDSTGLNKPQKTKSQSAISIVPSSSKTSSVGTKKAAWSQSDIPTVPSSSPSPAIITDKANKAQKKALPQSDIPIVLETHLLPITGLTEALSSWSTTELSSSTSPSSNRIHPLPNIVDASETCLPTKRQLSREPSVDLP